jgi:hypothetical protein
MGRTIKNPINKKPSPKDCKSHKSSPNRGRFKRGLERARVRFLTSFTYS